MQNGLNQLSFLPSYCQEDSNIYQFPTYTLEAEVYREGPIGIMSQIEISAREASGVSGEIAAVYSTDTSEATKDSGGKLSNNYPFPTDNQEFERLSKKHSADMVALNGLCPCPPEVVDVVLAPTGDLPKRVLDAGCGGGLWALEMANLYKHAEVVGLDLATVPLDSTATPSNLRFEQSDINQGLERFYARFDVVQAKSIWAGIADVRRTVDELQLCVKPGGLLILITGDMNLWDEHFQKLKMKQLEGDEEVDGIAENGSWFQRLLWETMQGSVKVGSDPDRGKDVINPGLWYEPLMDPDTAGGGTAYIPIGTWAEGANPAETEILKHVGTIFWQVFKGNHPAWQAILRKNGISQDTIDEWLKRADEELTNMNPRMYSRYAYCWARRRSQDNQPASPLPALTEQTKVLSDLRQRVNYPISEAYHTAEEARVAEERRNAKVGTFPTPLVRRKMMAKNSPE